MEHAVWVPGVPVLCESESTEMACPEETFVASSSRGQLVEYTAAATPNYDDPSGVVKRKAIELKRDNDQWREKMHRYPASIRDIGKRYTVPTIVSIGPYHHGLDHLKKSEEAKYFFFFFLREGGGEVCGGLQLHRAVKILDPRDV
jgi:hypothetical protein